jgi:hypothetical protein
MTFIYSAHPGESRDPSGLVATADSAWAPAFAGVSGV